MDEIYVYYTDLPGQIEEMVLPCQDGYTVYIDEGLDDESQIRAFVHALEHIRRGDCYGGDVQRIEEEAHASGQTA